MSIFFTYTFLIAAVAFGTASNILAKEAEGFSKIVPSLLSALTIVLCMYCLSQVMKTISAGYTYATFAGLCIIATSVLGILRFNQWPNFYAFFWTYFNNYWSNFSKPSRTKLMLRSFINL